MLNHIGLVRCAIAVAVTAGLTLSAAAASWPEARSSEKGIDETSLTTPEAGLESDARAARWEAVLDRADADRQFGDLISLGSEIVAEARIVANVPARLGARRSIWPDGPAFFRQERGEVAAGQRLGFSIEDEIASLRRRLEAIEQRLDIK